MPDRGEGAAGPSGTRAGRPSRGVVALIVVLGVLAVLMVGFATFAGLWTDWLWYRSVHYSSVFSTMAWTKIGLFVVFGLLMAGSVGSSMYLAHRLRPPLSAMSSEQQNLDRYRMGLAPYKTWVLLGVSAVVGLIAGGSAAAHWRLWLLMAHATPFHAKDPQFHKDISFYTFDLPFYRFLLNFGFAAVILSLVAATAVHYLYGGLRITSPGARVTSAATGHLAVLLGLFVSLKAAAYWLDRYSLAVRSSGFRTTDKWTGLRYVDANAYLPAKTILFFIAVICALLFFTTLWRRTWTLPTIGFGLMVLSAILIGGLYPAIVQKFQVLPNEAAKEAPYVQKNIDATRAAYGLTKTEVTPYPGKPAAKAAAAAGSPAATGTLRDDADASASLRVLDPNLVSPTFQELQQSSDYYQFPSTLDVDRAGGGTGQDSVVGLRELNVRGIPQNNWINDHFKYTHGYGVVAAKGSEVTGRGDPDFTEQGLPGGEDADGVQQRIYFGEQTGQYSIVGGPTPELDYADKGHETPTAYTGQDGVSLRNPLTRAAYAISFGEPKILYSGAIGKDSKILYNRTPKQRVEAVAPWLTIDGDPYPAVVGKKVEWVVDAYTTSDSYPYASRTTLGDTTADSQTDSQRSVVARQNQVNYIRNSVKATVDAYDGTVTLYQWDTQDPVLKTWMKAFPHTVRPKADIPADLLAHLRYPEDLFKVQREMLTTYHVTKAADFSSGSQVWAVPDDPAAKAGKAVPPYYMSLRMPDQGARSFSLTTTFTPSGQNRLSAFMAVDADASSAGYGTIRVLQLPATPTVDGPKLVQSKINASSKSAPKINALKQSGSDSTVEYGNLLTVPLDGGLLYMEPVYVRTAGVDYPQLASVAVLYGDDIAYRPTLSAALDDLFGPSGGTTSAKAPGAAATPPAAGSRKAPPGAPAATGDPALTQALADAQKAYDDGQAALRKNDGDAYRDAQQRLGDALGRAQEAAKAAGGSSVPAPSQTPAKKG
ncbi:UPF0182 family protein [Streptomyces cocklensis]|uniref:UPF0182 protein SCOCK_360010 n=1 Tax=Actinacidiphila cocklensis TaxID=887465 RepID=A0A9W4DQG2_9ACTN|nr:UPF0182 family protein [Actinacidiphila cocklensis]MDD1061220.1 UPF0182 family protein [Actinacidiphila cocklensis]CAG6395770.1 conserved membrane hypothetical protein [Actinacidiphila cocklensis]